MFTLYWTQAFFDGLQSHGEEDIVMLPRAGWVGTWRHGAVLWSGDIGSTMEVLKSQINIGISAQTSGIPWWTTDVGGYAGGKAEDPTYRCARNSCPFSTFRCDSVMLIAWCSLPILR